METGRWMLAPTISENRSFGVWTNDYYVVNANFDATWSFHRLDKKFLGVIIKISAFILLTEYQVVSLIINNIAPDKPGLVYNC